MPNPAGIVDRQTLEQAVLTYLENDDVNTNDFSLWLQFAEDDFSHDLKLEILEAAQSGNFVEGTAELPMPDGFIEPLTFVYYISSDVTKPLQYLPPTHFYDQSVFSSIPGAPTYYTIIGTDIVTRVPDSDYAYTLHYYKKPDSLTQPTSTSALLQSSPDIYLYACLKHAAAFFDDDKNQMRWEAAYNRSKDALHNADARKRYRAIGRVRPVMTGDRAWKLT